MYIDRNGQPIAQRPVTAVDFTLSVVRLNGLNVYVSRHMSMYGLLKALGWPSEKQELPSLR